ncbi:hypothetical protein V6N13_143249 [Hibiscus sabdariffa]
MQKMKARVRPEAVDRIADLSKKRSKVVVHTTSTPQHQTIRKEDMTSLDMYFSVQYSDMKARTDTQGFEGSKHRPEVVDCIGDSSKNRPKVVVHTTSISQCSTIRKEPMRTVVYSCSRLSGFTINIIKTCLCTTNDTILNSCSRCNSVFNFRQTFRIVLLKSRFEDTIFKTQQEMKASLDTQGFDLKNSVGSKRRPETVYRVGDSSKKRLKVAVHTTPTPRCPTVPKEETRTVGTYCFQFNIQPLNNFLLF